MPLTGLGIFEQGALPRWARVRQSFDTGEVDDVAAAVAAELSRAGIGDAVTPGARVAILAGSRGVDRVAEVVRALADGIRSRGGLPFVVPAMGSHGGATAAGQAEVLATQLANHALGIAEPRVIVEDGRLVGRVNLSSIAYGPLPRWLGGFRAAQPDVVVQLREATLDVQLDAFAAGEIDAGFVLHAEGAAPAGLAAWSVLREPLVVALPESHPLAARKALPFDRLAAEPLVIFPRAIAPSLFDAIVGHYRAQGATPAIAQEAIQMQTIVNLVSAGIGLAWVPASLMQLQRPGVVYRPLAGAALACETSLVWRPPASPVVQRFVDHVRQTGSAERRQSPAPNLARKGSR